MTDWGSNLDHDVRLWQLGQHELRGSDSSVDLQCATYSFGYLFLLALDVREEGSELEYSPM